MLGAGIAIPDKPLRISVRRRASGALRITYPRFGRAVVGGLALLAGLGVWLCQLPDQWWDEPLEYALALLLIAPGSWVLGLALRARPVVETSGGELLVRYGPVLCERVARLPLGTLEAGVSRRENRTVRVDGRVMSARLVSAFVPFYAAPAPEQAAGLYVLQLRNAGQEEWLSVFGSQLASEVENARLAIDAAAGGRARADAAEVVADIAEDEPPGGVSPSRESR